MPHRNPNPAPYQPTHNEPPRLVVITNLRAITPSSDRVILTEKFVDGMSQYASHWNGPIRVIAQPSRSTDSNLDHIEYPLSSLPFEFRCFNFTNDALKPALQDAAIVLAGFDHDKTLLAPLCKQLNVPLIYITEYSTRTQLQIIAAGNAPFLKKLRASLWVKQQRKPKNRALSQATALQCNGTPTYNEYTSINPNRLLYFDTRVTANLLATHQQIDNRRDDHSPIRLLFSGRLIPMKGASHLPHIAHYLLENRTPFQLKIAGDGESLLEIKNLIKTYNLQDHVQTLGNLDFKSQLLPLAKSWADLFVCPHRQGDPACTYLETYSCGIPIVGYDNEALTGLVSLTNIGSTVPLNNTKQLADRITAFAHKRDKLYRHAHRALDFASENTFELTFKKRIEHLKYYLNPPPA
ncbi:Alpha-D-kanosaminyltransferase [Poriferisphaera corsica]|uniref:Alpha-D-kanosaminyltransferase n=1 Tax=Poriferisphaera corsica TaxID=2528020 RepID=A0A517YYH7_9BACT|nr:glycosyltransferase [Poriferisphaera corsica]QDU35273.1 Alpha-D-kanosaminyltransferase [Poriferisphaera corsica]